MSGRKDKRLKALIVHLEKEGARVRETARMGYYVTPRDKDKPPFTFHGSTSDWRAWKNVRAEVLRAGHTWPFSEA